MNPADYGFPIFKGLQKPFEFMGIRGRFMVLAAAGIGVSFLAFCVGMIICSTFVGFALGGTVGAVSLVTIFLKQKQGLHNKSKCKDTLIYHYLFIRK